MTFNRQGFPSIIEDNEEIYYRFLTTLVESVDPQAQGTITKAPNSVTIRITPSQAILQNILLKTIKEANNAFSLRVEFSKSITTSRSVVYKIMI